MNDRIRMNRKLLVIGAVAFAAASTMGAAKGCSADPRVNDGDMNVPTADNGKHYISSVGKWKYSTTVAPSNARFPQCKWEVWGLQRDGWKRLYHGNSTNKAKLPPQGVYNSAYLKSTGCGKWHAVK